MLILLLTTDPDLFGLDAPGPALDGSAVDGVVFFTFIPSGVAMARNYLLSRPCQALGGAGGLFPAPIALSQTYFQGSATSPELTDHIAENSSNQHSKSSQTGLSLDPELFKQLATVLTTTPLLYCRQNKTKDPTGNLITTRSLDL
jgi:hypothetical protein